MAKSSPITLSRIEAVALDQASLNAARKLLNQSKWPSMEQDAGGRLLWGACQGSGATAYRVAVEIADLGAKCACPSRKFPCKHAIALMWWMAEQPEKISEGEIPEWVNEWQGRRRRTAPANDAGNAPGPQKSAKAAVAAKPAKPKDPERAKKQKERVRKAREKSIRQGLDELDTWIGDLVDRGFGGFSGQASEQCRLLAQRLVDAKAGGIAGQVDALPSLYFRTPEAERYDVLLKTLGGLHLLAQAYRRQEALDPALRADVRTRVGWTMTRDELFASKDAARVTSTWTVLATRRESQADRLVRYETWLAAANNEELQTAVLLDFVPAASAAGAGPSLEPGTTLDAELVFYPSATPLRAQIATQSNVQAARNAPSPRNALGAALAEYDRTLAQNPWVSEWPIAFNKARVLSDGNGRPWALDHDNTGVPLAGDSGSVLRGLDELELFGTFDGRELTLLAANSVLGPLWCTP